MAEQYKQPYKKYHSVPRPLLRFFLALRPQYPAPVEGLPADRFQKERLQAEKISVCSERGARPEQEDRYLVDAVRHGAAELQVRSVMDGHGGDQTADYVQHHLLTALQLGVNQMHGREDYEINSGIRLAFNELNRKTAHDSSGTTLSIAVIPPGEQVAYIAILGDSPVFLKDRHGKLIIYNTHNAVLHVKARQEAAQRGAVFEDGYLRGKNQRAGLQLSRSLGDKDLSFLVRNPDIYKAELGHGSFIVIASDGILNARTVDSRDRDRQIRRLADMVESGANAEDLVDDALERHTGDNVTAIVQRL